MTIKGYVEAKKLECIVYEKLKQMGLWNTDYSIDPYELISSEGIILHEKYFDDDNIRGMLVNGDNFSGIVINSNRSDVSRRFIAMHELCHYWFHPRTPQTVCFEDYSKVKKGIEWQANNAAAYALMPTEILMDAFDYCDGNLNYLCTHFNVSRDSMNYRIKELGLQKSVDTNFKNIVNHDTKFDLLENGWLYSGL